MAKNKIPASGIVYSTDPGFKPFDVNEEKNASLLPTEQKLRVRLDTKHRAGKAVTLLEGFSGKNSEKEAIGKKLKTFCGTGGSVKDGEIIVQGDQRDKVVQWLLKNGYKQAKKV
ncbi:MAG: translation initiation factor [Ferruginibacter sp.]